METLVTLIGNAAVDPYFRKGLLNDPVDIVDKYGFRLTKGDFEMMKALFTDFKDNEKEEMNGAFDKLEGLVYQRLEPVMGGKCGHPCRLSIFPPPELRPEREKPENATGLKKGGKAKAA